MQIVWSSRAGSRRIEYLGSAHSDAEVAALRKVAADRLAGGQQQLALDLAEPAAESSDSGALRIVASRMGHLWDALERAYARLGFEQATGADEVFKQLVLARIIEPTSKFDAARVLEEAGEPAASYATVKRRLAEYGRPRWRERLAGACAAHGQVGPATLVLYDVTTLYYEAHEGDGFREPGFSEERRLEPQITVGLLTDQHGFPLQVDAFEGNTAETKTMLPVIEAFKSAHGLKDVTVVADAGMVSEGNKKALEAAGLSFVLGEKMPKVPYQLQTWQKNHPDQEPADGQILTQPWPAGPSDQRREHVIYYQYRSARARRTLRGIDQQVAKARAAVNGKAPVKRNRFVTLTGGKKTLNTGMEATSRALAGWKADVTDRLDVGPEFVIGAHHQLWRIEQSFRMSKSDLRARPIYARKRDSIEAHLTVVFAALAITRYIENTTGWTIKKFVQTARRYQRVTLRVGEHLVPAEPDLPADLRTALALIT